ncbi:hypothetical protein [Mycetocola sp. JXN-3]|uniref:hypothetical protein n=1 Tax=Mycetocola sp. JXN-3 TaxID=2116510 RepID=UPI00165D2884|nr:hypothetical protein [Mycetocola sp. JXN-3]
MNRQRTIKPDLFRNEDLAGLSPAVRLTAIGLQLCVDDHGRASATAALLKADLWALDREVTEDVVDEHLLQLAEIGYLVLYAVGKRTYLVLTDRARVDRPTASKIPEPPAQDPLASGSGATREPLAVEEEERGREWEREWENESRSGRASEEDHSGAARESLGPSMFCPDHEETLGTLQPCGPCGTARQRHKIWTQRQIQKAAGPRFEDEG